MLKTREAKEREEAAMLAPYGQRVTESAGRMHAEPAHPFRTAYQRDRARIIHSRAFRRLEYKTQVFLNGTGDHLRTRLTHTIEVASLSRTIACALGANEDLAEAVALAHDLGHAPFGHSGEDKLNELMRGHGGFEHNGQSQRVVEITESTYPRFAGLNLSYEVLEGLRKHEKGYVRKRPGSGSEERFSSPSLEAQIANLADEITYYSHDLDDGLDHNLICEDQLEELELWRVCTERVQKDFPDLEGKKFRSYVIRSLIDHEVEDVVSETDRRLKEGRIESSDDVRRCEKGLVAYSDALRRANLELRRFLYQNLYFHDVVARVILRACVLIVRVFLHLVAHPGVVGREASGRIESDGIHRAVCDYVSGMTDRYIAEEAERLGV